MGEFPGIQWLGLGPFTTKGKGLIPAQGTNILYTMQWDRKKKKKRNNMYTELEQSLQTSRDICKISHAPHFSYLWVC